MMKAVIVTSSYSYLERTVLLREYYEETGYDTTVIETDFIHAQKKTTTEHRDGFVFLPTKTYKKNISIQRLYSHHRFANDVARLLENLKPDLLHILLPANSLAKVGSDYKKKHSEIKLVFDLIDLWPEAMPLSCFKGTYPFRSWKELRDRNLGMADRVYCECQLFCKVLGKEDDSRFRPLYWVKNEEPIESHPQLSETEIHLCYLGSINNIIDIEYIARLCDTLGERKPVVLHVIGDGEKKQEFISRLSRTRAKVTDYGVVYDRQQKQEIFDRCHFGLNMMKQTVCVGLTMKSLDYFQGGLPILNNLQGDIAELIKSDHIGYNGYEDFLREEPFLKKEDYLQMREAVRAVYQRQFTVEAFKKQLEHE